MYKYISILTGEVLEMNVDSGALLKNVFRFKHESWKLAYVGKNVFAVYNDYNIFFQRLCLTSSGNMFGLDVAVQGEVGRCILAYIKKGGESK